MPLSNVTEDDIRLLQLPYTVKIIVKNNVEITLKITQYNYVAGYSRFLQLDCIGNHAIAE